MIYKDGWKCLSSFTCLVCPSLTYIPDLFLAACDVEGNFLVVKAYQYTTLLSCMLLDWYVPFTFLHLRYPDPDHSWAIPVCMFFQWVWQRPRYHWTQILGVFIAMVGLALQVVSDHLTSKDWVATNMVRGDIFMLVGATLYGFSECPLRFMG